MLRAQTTSERDRVPRRAARGENYCCTLAIHSFVVMFAVFVSFLFLGCIDLKAVEFRSFGAFSSAYAISGDGNVVAGASGELWRWTQETGIIELPNLDLPGNNLGRRINAISFDGEVIVGSSRSSQIGQVGFLWTEADGTIMIGQADQQPVITSAVDVSADGNTILVTVSPGSSTRAGAVFSASEGGITDEILLPEVGFSWDSAAAYVISADGQSVYGGATVVPNEVPFRWTGAMGSMVFEDFTVSGRGEVTDVSFDESVFVGTKGFSGSAAFRWTRESGFDGLFVFDPPDVLHSEAFAVSGDGALIAGAFALGFEPTTEDWIAGIWDETHTWRSVEQVLIDSGVDISGWKLLSTVDISDDGRKLVGGGVNPEGDREAWFVDLSNPTLLPGDYNANNVVEQGDLDLVLLHWGSEFNMFEPPEGWNRNLPSGRVDQAELDAVLLNWGAMQAVAGSAASIPEPRSLLLLMVLAPLLGRSRSSRLHNRSGPEGASHGAATG